MLAISTFDLLGGRDTHREHHSGRWLSYSDTQILPLVVKPVVIPMIYLLSRLCIHYLPMHLHVLAIRVLSGIPPSIESSRGFIPVGIPSEFAQPLEVLIIYYRKLTLGERDKPHPNIPYMAKKSKPIWLLLSAKKPLRYKKQVLHTGDFKKLDGEGDGIEFSITPEILDHLAHSIGELRTAGVQIPFANGHDDWANAANRLGDVVGAVVEDGNLSLEIDFADEASRDLALKADVSIGMLDKFYDGRGQLHRTVIRHLAATSAPVIPALDEWHQIAASFNKPNNNMDELYTLLGIDKQPELLLAAVKELQEKAKPVEKVDLSFPPLVIRTVRDAREATLSAFVTQGVFTPAVKAELVTQFCTDKAVNAELSHNEAGQGFDFAVKLATLASKSKPISPTGRSAAPTAGEVELSHNGNGTTYSQRVAKWAETYNGRMGGNESTNRGK